MLSSDWMRVGITIVCVFCPYEYLTNLIQQHSLEIPDIDLAHVHCPGQYLKSLL